MEGLFEEEEEEETIQGKGKERLPKELPVSGLDLILSRMEPSFGEVSTRLTDMSKGQTELNKGQNALTQGQTELNRSQRDLTMKLRDMVTGQQDLTDGLTDLTRRFNEMAERQEDMRKRQNNAEDIIGSVIYRQSENNDNVNQLIEAIQRREMGEEGEEERDRGSNPYRSELPVSAHQAEAPPYALATDTSILKDGREEEPEQKARATQTAVRVSKRLQGKSRPDYLTLHNAGFPLYVPPSFERELPDPGLASVHEVTGPDRVAVTRVIQRPELAPPLTLVNQLPTEGGRDLLAHGSQSPSPLVGARGVNLSISQWDNTLSLGVSRGRDRQGDPTAPKSYKTI